MLETEWHYLIHMPDNDVIRCPGNEDVAIKHLKAIREDWVVAHPDPPFVPYLIGVYPPNAIGGPDGVGGVYSYGFTPTHTGSIDKGSEFIPVDKV